MPQFPLVHPCALQSLAGLVGEVAGLDAGPATLITPQIAALALERHQVGGFLYAALASGRHAAPAGVAGLLAEDDMLNRIAQSQTEARLARIADALDGLPWMVLKGLPQARLLYADPAWRHSSDIDILVPPHVYVQAAGRLQQAGYIAASPPLSQHTSRRRPVMKMVRDVLFVGRDIDHAVELHQRPLFAAHKSLTLSAGSGFPPTPALGPALALYLFIHGAECFWVRLKWLADLVPLLAKLGDDDKERMIAMARTMGVDNAFAASLWLLQSLFPAVALGPLAPWLRAMTGRDAVRARALRYGQMLGWPGTQRLSPLNDARLALEGKWTTHQRAAVRARLLVRAPIAHMARRIAAAARPADRALV